MVMPPLRLPIRPSPQTPLQAALWACAGALGLVFAYSCSYNLLLFAPSIYLLQIYDRVLSSRSADTLLMLTLIVGLAVVVGAVLDALRRAVLIRLAAWLEDRLRPTVLAACFDRALCAEPARAAETYRDLTALRQFTESGACLILFDVLWAPIFIGVLFLVHPLLGAIAALVSLFLLGLSFAGEAITEAPLSRAAAALTRTYGRLAAALDNVHVIRAMGMLDGAGRLIHQAAQDARSAHDMAQRRNEMVMLVGKPVRALSQVLIMGAAAWLVLDNARSPAIIFAASLLFGRAIAPIEGVIAGWKAFVAVLAAHRRLSGVLNDVAPAPETKDVPADGLNGKLIVDNIGVAVPASGSILLRGISFSLSPGECLGIIGPAGSGKSTLGRIIAGVSIPTAGTVSLGSIAVPLLRETGAGRHLGYLPQDIDLFGETIKDVIARLDTSEPQDVVAAAKLIGLHETIMRLPQAYDTMIAGGDTMLSRGCRQRLGLARAFFGAPRLVVLDEPNASLDYVGERMLFEAIEQLKAANAIVIIITHRMGILAATDKIAIMQNGAMCAFGESKEIYERYLARPHVTARENAAEPAEGAPDEVAVRPHRRRSPRKRTAVVPAQNGGPAS
jgi:PrtD family type I secretion system ABC transporter